MCLVGILLYHVLGHLLQVAIRITVYRAAVLRVPREQNLSDTPGKLTKHCTSH